MIRRAIELGAKLFFVGWAARNVIGLIAVIPVFGAMIEAGGAPMAIWIAVCSIAGAALNIIVPMLALRKLRRMLEPACIQGAAQ